MGGTVLMFMEKAGGDRSCRRAEKDEECHDVWGKEVQVRLIMEWTKLKRRDRVSKWGGDVRRF